MRSCGRPDGHASRCPGCDAAGADRLADASASFWNGSGSSNCRSTAAAIRTCWSRCRAHLANQGFGIGALVRGYGLPSGSTTLTFDGAAQNEVWEGWDVARTPDLDTIAGDADRDQQLLG